MQGEMVGRSKRTIGNVPIGDGKRPQVELQSRSRTEGTVEAFAVVRGSRKQCKHARGGPPGPAVVSGLAGAVDRSTDRDGCSWGHCEVTLEAVGGSPAAAPGVGSLGPAASVESL